MDKFVKKELRSAALTVRLRPSTVWKLVKIAKANEISQADVIEQLIEQTFAEMEKKETNQPKPKKNRTKG